MTPVIGTVTRVRFDGGTLSAPAFLDVDFETIEGKIVTRFARGKLAKRLQKVIQVGNTHTFQIDQGKIVGIDG